jgi:hypothetical protein
MATYSQTCDSLRSWQATRFGQTSNENSEISVEQLNQPFNHRIVFGFDYKSFASTKHKKRCMNIQRFNTNMISEG